MHQPNVTGISFFFTHDGLKKELKQQIEKNTRSLSEHEVRLPRIDNELLSLERAAKARSEEYQDNLNLKSALEYQVTHLNGQNKLLAFYMEHLDATVDVTLTLSDVRMLGLVDHETGIGYALGGHKMLDRVGR